MTLIGGSVTPLTYKLIPNECLCDCLCNTCQEPLGEFDGGVKIGGSVVVCNNFATYQDMAVWPLVESASPYLDRSSHSWDGTATNPPTQVVGINCQWGQRFDGREWIDLPSDDIPEENAFSVSMFVNISSYYQQRQWFSRGNPFVFSFGHSVLNSLWARVVVPSASGNEIISCFGDTVLARDKWYHVAAVFRPNIGLSVYLNGVLDGTISISESSTITKIGLNYIARANDAGSPEGKMQEVRLHLVEREPDWFLAEMENFCTDFYRVDKEVATGIFD